MNWRWPKIYMAGLVYQVRARVYAFWFLFLFSLFSFVFFFTYVAFFRLHIITISDISYQLLTRSLFSVVQCKLKALGRICVVRQNAWLSKILNKSFNFLMPSLCFLETDGLSETWIVHGTNFGWWYMKCLNQGRKPQNPTGWH